MRKWAKIVRVILFPDGKVFFFLVPLSAALLIYTFIGSEVHEVRYASYIISAYTLTAVCCKLPGILCFWKEIGQRNKYIAKYRNDTGWRMTVSLYTSFVINTAYAILQLGLGVIYSTIWYYSMAAYYFMLSVMRFYLLHYLRGIRRPGKDKVKELHRYRFCGTVLLGMNLALAVIVYYITWQNRTFVHHTITTIAMAAYTFTSFTMAAVSLIRYRKYQSPVLSAAKIIGFTSAMVSMLTLETTMLTVFGGGEKESFDRTMTGTTGAVITLTVLIMAIYMIVKSTKKLKYIKKGEMKHG